MTKIRVLVFLSSLLIVGVLGIFASYYARGYRFSFKRFKFLPNGILVIKSEPDGASIFINGDLKGATNTNLSLPPATYDLEVKKDGYLSWYKRITIEKEIVTQESVSLFKSLPALSPITFSGANKPTISQDNSKIAYADLDGIWIIDIVNLPLGFGRDPKKITEGDFTEAEFEFSPDAKELLVTTSKGIYTLDTASFTAQSERVNISSTVEDLKLKWKKQLSIKNASLLSSMPQELSDIFLNKTEKLIFSPDETMILYTASNSASLPENLIPQLPGSSTQKQERDIKIGQTYIYDIKEDRNFYITDSKVLPHWMPTSRHILLSEEGKILIADYDGTNRQTVYEGSYIAPYAFPFSNTSKLLILTSLGSASTPNLYSVSVK